MTFPTQELTESSPSHSPTPHPPLLSIYVNYAWPLLSHMLNHKAYTGILGWGERHWSDFFHSTSCLWNLSMFSMQFLFPYSLHELCLNIFILLLGIWVGSSLGCFELIGTFFYMSFSGHAHFSKTARFNGNKCQSNIILIFLGDTFF